MKKYIGTKQIEAESMTRGDAWGKHLLREKPTVDNFDDPGYHVKYKDGYESWSPKDVFDEAYKCSESFLDRLCIEFDDLRSKLDKLVPFVKSGKIDEVVTDKEQNHLLRLQLSIMTRYIEVLHSRMELAKGYDSVNFMTFGDAVDILKQGGAIRRVGWYGKGLYVFKQVPAHIGEDVIPKMQSLPQSAKDLILQGRGFIDYTSQCLIYNEDTGRADSWVPSISDVFADDWEIVTHTSLPCDHVPGECDKCIGNCRCDS